MRAGCSPGATAWDSWRLTPARTESRAPQWSAENDTRSHLPRQMHRLVYGIGRPSFDVGGVMHAIESADDLAICSVGADEHCAFGHEHRCHVAPARRQQANDDSADARVG